ncbi:hypothetical protein [Streptomyces deccanensis]|nr:hypothetical protein [Streptomyces deccanensis]
MTLQPIRSAQRHCPGEPVALVDEPDADAGAGAGAGARGRRAVAA